MRRSKILEDNENWALLTFPELTELRTKHVFLQGEHKYWIMFFEAPDGGHLGYRVMWWMGYQWLERVLYTNYFQEIHYNAATRSDSGIYRNPSLDSYVERGAPGYRNPREAEQASGDREQKAE